MIVSELKPLPEVLQYLDGENRVFIVGCNGCAQASGTGGPAQVREMRQNLEKQGKTVTGSTVIDFLCEKALIKMRLMGLEDQVRQADSLLAMTCGIGVQATAASVDKPVHPACNTISVGGAQGEWPGKERCAECGECVLDFTGGICPLTACSKSLISGQCGGSKNGRCEVEPDVRECGWVLIYNRLQKIGRLDKMKNLQPIKNYLKMQPPKAIRSTIKWALETEEKKLEVAAK